MPATDPAATAHRALLCNCFAVRKAARRVTQLYDQHMAPLGLRAAQFSVLSHLRRLGPLAIGELAAEMAMDRTTMGRALRPLEREGLVAIGPGRDGRTRALSLTDAGLAKLREAVAAWKAAQRQFEAAYGADEAAALRAALGRVVAALPVAGTGEEAGAGIDKDRTVAGAATNPVAAGAGREPVAGA
ncbi:MarR family winged helix-turn-helix transcriptional regulator [Roseomonas sp. NAR14]|uniref:MarR family winged helix-turn-helix transcriptional regulator n=1 Tax=Roseomonas acroporae TaxID=2937791 RepID=A0A9X2BT45_9PROT|nr:MarR family winged helix-turn-helix transcriptional regulator [Roseomonas acroporae]MCK8782921.1 MarR family winged helix-turn-helix transcriptional regulator [Roseomonas acroporae]